MNEIETKARELFAEGYLCAVGVLYQGALIMTHRDRLGVPPGRRKAVSMGHYQCPLVLPH